MKEIDTIGLKQAEFLGSIFEKTFSLSKLSSANFIRKFMFSDYELLFSKNSIMFEIRTEEQIIKEIDNTTIDNRKGIKYNPDSLFWIGYIYAYWSYTYSKRINEIYRWFKPEELNKLYFAYHTFDPAFAISRMMEAKGLKENRTIEEKVKLFSDIVDKRVNNMTGLEIKKKHLIF